MTIIDTTAIEQGDTAFAIDLGDDDTVTVSILDADTYDATPVGTWALATLAGMDRGTALCLNLSTGLALDATSTDLLRQWARVY